MLLRAWMEPHRTGEVDDELVPFDRNALTVLRNAAQGRPGPLLNRANELFDAGASQQLGRIDGDFARRHFAGSALSPGANDKHEVEDYVAEVEDLLR